MNGPENTLEEILKTLTLLRSQGETRRKFPKDTWNSIIRLTKTLPFNRVCGRLKINPFCLKQKVRESNEHAAPKGPEERLKWHQKESGPITERLKSFCNSLIEEKKVEPNKLSGESNCLYERLLGSIYSIFRYSGSSSDE